MMALTNGRITELAFKVIIIVFFGIAISSAVARMIIRLWLHNRLWLGDYLLLFSCVFLTGATGVLYYGTPTIFFGAKLTFNPTETGMNEADTLHIVDLIQKINWAYLALSWVTIFFVKFGFLSLFKNVVDRLPPMYRLWKGVVIFTILVFAFAVCDGFVACPKLGIEVVQCSSTASLNKALIGIAVIALDILTDVFILAIPICLLWRVRMKSRQKLGLAVFLCLSICMIIMAIIRVSGIHYHGKFDNTWILMWQQVEACIAVTMLSLTAFRSLFVTPKPGVNNMKASPWVPSTRRLFGNHKKSNSNGQQRLDDLTISSATLTGLSHFSNEIEVTHSKDESITLDTWPLSPEIEHQSSTQI